MANSLGPTPPAGYLPYGRVSELWERGVLLALNVTVPFVYIATYQSMSAGWPPSLEAQVIPWVPYGVAQLANKIPISYTPSGGVISRAIDLATYAVLLAATLAYAMDLSGHVGLSAWRAGCVIVLVGMLHYWFGPRILMADGSPIPIRRQLFARLVGTLINLPMLFALAAVASER